MKPSILPFASLIASIWLICSCSETKVEPSFSFNIKDYVILTSEKGAQTTVSFTSTYKWEAYTSDNWLSVSPSAGQAGSNVITLTANSENTSEQYRSATLMLTSEGISQSIHVRQETYDYIQLEQTDYPIGAEGGILEIIFSTNIDPEELVIRGNATWLNQDIPSRAKAEYSVTLNVDPNTSVSSRTAKLYFVKEKGNKQTILTTVTISQEGASDSASTDYTEDGKVKTLQEATEGNGIPIILMGDGFIDTEINDGTYNQAMYRAYEYLFSEEPIKSLKNYFDVYSVTAVSKNNIFGDRYETAFSCKLEGGGSTGISGDDYAVMGYSRRVENIDQNKVLAVVILNTHVYAGTTYFGYENVSTQQMTDFAIAYCPIIENLNSEYFREVLTHEAIGHGFAKLEDEYAYEENGTIPDEEIQTIKNLQSSYGWAQNVDFTDNPDEVLWKRFLNDERYADEGLGIYEGACTYIRGAYRPTQNSMMNENTLGFNAPSRKAIYDRVMKDGTGETPSYESFANFDQQLSLQTRHTRSLESDKKHIRFARPRFAGKSLPETSK